MEISENIVEIGIKIICRANESAQIIQKVSSLDVPNIRIKMQDSKIPAMAKEEFRSVRKVSRLTQEEYCEELGLSQGYVSELERGDKPITEEIAKTARDVLVKYTKKARTE